jgi:hypothetical protein
MAVTISQLTRPYWLPLFSLSSLCVAGVGLSILADHRIQGGANVNDFFYYQRFFLLITQSFPIRISLSFLLNAMSLCDADRSKKVGLHKNIIQISTTAQLLTKNSGSNILIRQWV